MSTPHDNDGGWRAALTRVLAIRYAIIGAFAAAATVTAGGRGDWNFFVSTGRDMLGRNGLAVFVAHPDAQTGPIHLLLARLFALTPRNGFLLCVVVCGALGVAAIHWLEQAQRAERRDDVAGTRLTVLLGGIVVAFWWSKLGGYGHLDDAIVLSTAAFAIQRVRTDRRLSAAIAIGLTIAVKPWAVILLPLTIGRTGPVARRLRSPAVGAAVGAVLWAPFLITNPATMSSLRPTVSVAYDSVIRLIGESSSDLPAWLRVVQLCGAGIVALVAMRRGSVAGAMFGAIAIRVVTDPGTWSYYTAGFVIAALAWDLLERESVTPLITLAISALMLPEWLIPDPDERAVMRFSACALAVLLAISSRGDEVHERIGETSVARPSVVGVN